MTWVRLDDGYPEHPKVDQVGPLAAWLNVCAWAYSARNLTDGFVPSGRVARLADVPKPQQLVDALLHAGLWHYADKPCGRCVEKREAAGSGAITDAGYLVHDYLEYNPSRENIGKERDANRRRVAQWRSHASNGVTDDVRDDTNGISNGARTGTPLTTRTRTSSKEDEARERAQEGQTTDVTGVRRFQWSKRS